ncbi:MAG: addiction module protein [Calditrichia bacterium]
MSIKTDELMDLVESLPTDIKTKLIEKILNTLNPTHKEMDKLWADEAEKRLEEIKSGKIKTIPAEKVFKEIRRKYR